MREVELKIKTELEVIVLTIALEETVAQCNRQVRWLKNSHSEDTDTIEDYASKAKAAKGLLAQVDKLLEK